MSEPTSAMIVPAAFELRVRGKRLGPCGACAFFNARGTRESLQSGHCYAQPPQGQSRVVAAAHPGCAQFVAADAK